MFPRVVRIATSVILTGLVIVAVSRFSIFNETTAALILILEILFISTWGRTEAFAAAIVAGLGLDYFFLPPSGLGISRPDQIIEFGTFVVIALAMGYATNQMKAHRVEAIAHREWAEKLQKLGNALLGSEDAESVISRLPDCIVQTFGIAEAALYDQPTARFVRSSSQASVIPEDKLREVALLGESFVDPASGIFLLPLRAAGKLAGSLGIKAEACIEDLVNQIAYIVSAGLAKAHAAEKEMTAEVARRADELKSAVLDALVHEIKSPLASMNVAASVLLSSQRGSEAQQSELLGAIKRDINRLNHQIDEAVCMAQIRSGEFSLDRKPNCVNDIIFDSLAEVAVLLAGRSIQTDFEESLPTVDCDAPMIKHAVKALLDNAAKYSRPGSTVKVSGRSVGYQVVVSITNTGRALADDEIERIFEKLYRGRQACASGVPGTGLGLASAKSILEAHNGRIWATPEPEGNTFHFSLLITKEVRDECCSSPDRR